MPATKPGVLLEQTAKQFYLILSKSDRNLTYIFKVNWPCLLALTFNISIWEAEAGLLSIWAQSKTPSSKGGKKDDGNESQRLEKYLGCSHTMWQSPHELWPT